MGDAEPRKLGHVAGLRFCMGDCKRRPQSSSLSALGHMPCMSHFHSSPALGKQQMALTAARMVYWLAVPATGSSNQLVEPGLMETEVLAHVGVAAKKGAQVAKGAVRPWICMQRGATQ